MNIKRSQYDLGYAFVLLTPAMILLFTFTHYPALKSLVASFFSTPKGRRPSVFIGLDNYETLIADPVFWKVMTNTLVYALLTIPASIGLSLLMAIAVNKFVIGRAGMRVAYFTPTVLPLIAVGSIWLFFLTPGIGLIDQLRLMVGLPSQNWLFDPDTALYSVAAVAIWKEAGFFMIFYLAALQSISPTFKEAATVEGAGSWDYFRRIVWPLLMPTTLFISVNATINAVRMVDHIFIMTAGGPNNASSLLLYYIYQIAFEDWNTSYAAALTVVMVVILVAVAIGQFIVMDRRVHYK